MSVKEARKDGGLRDVRNSGGKICDWLNVGNEGKKNSMVTHDFLGMGATH